MATTKNTKKAKTVDADFLISAYMEWALEHNKPVDTVYRFCKDSQIEEAEFYQFFGSLKGIRQAIWSRFFEQAQHLLENDPQFVSATAQNQLLSLYFTLIEVFTLNRSYVLLMFDSLKNPNEMMAESADFRKKFLHFTSTMTAQSTSKMSEQISRFRDPLVRESYWVLWGLIVQFWRKDTSAGFEKTDAFIEKTVQTAFAITDSTPLNHLIDLGKFMWAERKF